MAEKLCQKFGPGPHALKIGKSFEKKGGNSVYHSIRYDFKPNSIDEERKGLLEVKEKQSVTVQLPHNDGVGQTNYKGNAETAPTRDCVLIIDHETGELTLERVSNKIMVKKTRTEKVGTQSSNPYEVKPDAPNPYEVKSNPYEVKSNPYEVKANPYEVRAPDIGNKPRPPDKQRTSHSSGRPNTPQQLPAKKRSPGYPALTESLSPLHSNKSSPASNSGRVASSQGYNVDSLGRTLSSSSDSSDSDSDSDVDDPKPVKVPPPPAPLPVPVDQSSSAFSMPGDLCDLLPVGEVAAKSGGTLPTARPSSKTQPSSPNKPKYSSRTEPSYPSPSIPTPPAQVRPTASGMPDIFAPPAPGMPDIFGDLGDDLELSDDDSE